MRYLPLVLILAICGCCKIPIAAESPEKVDGDLFLRGFLGLRTLVGNYTIPEGDDAYELTVLDFEDGKLVSSGMSFRGTASVAGTRELQSQLLFDPETGDIMLGSNSGSVKSASQFWKKLDGGWSSNSGALPEMGGFKILAFVTSNLEQSGTKEQTFYGSFSDSLKIKKFVGALGVRSALKPGDLKN